MADAIGILSFALSATKQIYDIVKTIKDAPDDTKTLQAESEHIQLFLSTLIDVLQTSTPTKPDRASAQFSALVEEARKLTESAKALVDKATVKKADGSSKVVKIKWLRYASSAKKLVEDFKRFNLLFCAFMSIHTQQQLSAAVVVFIQSAANQQRRGQNHFFDEVSLPNVEEPTAPLPLQSSPPFVDQQLSFPDPSMSSDPPEPPVSFPIPSVSSPTSQSSSATASESLRLETQHNSSHDEARHPPRHVPLDDSTCPLGCRCSCHRMIQATPRFLSLFGTVYLQYALISLLTAATTCDNATCRRPRDALLAVKYQLPTWFFGINAEVRIDAIPIDFRIQTPRFVENLDDFLYQTGSLRVIDVQKMLSQRQITLHDVGYNGLSVLHWLFRRVTFDLDELAILDTIQYVLEAGAPAEWTEGGGLTAAEFILWRSIIARQSSTDTMRSLQLTIAGPYLHEDPDETWASLQRKTYWTDLHLLFVDYRSPLVSLDVLDRMLKLPSTATHLNARDTWGKTSLFYAICVQPEAVEVLLRAGANPWLVGTLLSHAANVGADAAIGLLIRAGSDVNAREQYGRTALHIAALPPDKAASSVQRYQAALALLRHGGHAIDWGAPDRWGQTPLYQAEQTLEDEPRDSNCQTIVELYTARDIPSHAKYIPPPRVVDAASEDNLNISTSLVAAGLCGNSEAIGRLIHLGAMVNERDDNGYTLLHLVAMGRVRDGYKVALELVRHGGYGVDWEAQTRAGETALTLARTRLERDECEEARNVLRLLEARRLPLGERYLFPCMDPAYCRRCSSFECICAGFPMPGGFQ